MNLFRQPHTTSTLTGHGAGEDCGHAGGGIQLVPQPSAITVSPARKVSGSLLAISVAIVKSTVIRVCVPVAGVLHLVREIHTNCFARDLSVSAVDGR